MILAMLFSVAAMYVGARRTGIAEHVLGRPAPLAREGPIFTIEEILNEPAKRNLLGRDVAIWGVTVQRVTGDWLFWIGVEPGREMPVTLLGEQTGRQIEAEIEIRAGDVVAVFGTMHPLRDMILEDDQLAAHHDERAALSRVQVYISALRVEKLRR